MTEVATESKTCSVCAYWNETGAEGECRAKAPQTIVLTIDSETKVESLFPTTKGTDWCGEFSSK
ncbi:MAG: hypothetical protein AAF212_00265 [Verrucomicrobiota bacterium]